MSISRTFQERIQNELDGARVDRAYYQREAANKADQIADLESVLAAIADDVEPAPDAEVDADESAAEQPTPVVDETVGEQAEPAGAPAEVPSEPEPATQDEPQAAEPEATPDPEPAEVPEAQDGYVDDDGDEYAWTEDGDENTGDDTSEPDPRPNSE